MIQVYEVCSILDEFLPSVHLLKKRSTSKNHVTSIHLPTYSLEQIYIRAYLKLARTSYGHMIITTETKEKGFHGCPEGLTWAL